MNFIRTTPIYKECVWGSDTLFREFHRPVPPNVKIGESWDIADRPHDTNMIIGGRFDGKTLHEAMSEDCEYIMGPCWNKSSRFPIMVKWLDAAEKLSLQVHPNEKSAKIFDGEIKTENWYIAKCKSGAKITVGLKRSVNKREFCAALADHTVMNYLHEIEVKEGDVILIPSGRLHSIGAGNLILEIQQNSDTTYRVYDWGRLGLDGKPRKLHIEEFLESADFNDYEPSALPTLGKSMSICECPSFSSRTLYMKKDDTLQFGANEQPRILSVIKGSLESECSNMAGKSENIILPYGQKQKFTAKDDDTLIIITENFADKK